VLNPRATVDNPPPPVHVVSGQAWGLAQSPLLTDWGTSVAIWGRGFRCIVIVQNLIPLSAFRASDGTTSLTPSLFFGNSHTVQSFRYNNRFGGLWQTDRGTNTRRHVCRASIASSGNNCWSRSPTLSTLACACGVAYRGLVWYTLKHSLQCVGLWAYYVLCDSVY